METIKINHGEQAYEIKSIMPVSTHVLQVAFDNQVPEAFGDVEVYTSGGILCAFLPGYSTVYNHEGQTVYLSDDGSRYQPPEAPPIEPYMPTQEELLTYARASKKAEVSAACEQIIRKGITVKLSDGAVEHFSLTDHDQINLFGKQAQLAAGAEKLEYHADGQPCRYYSAEDMQMIIQAATFHVSYHTTYCNALNIWIAECQTADEVGTISYGADVPEEYRSEVLDAYLIQIAAMTGGDAGEEMS